MRHGSQGVIKRLFPGLYRPGLIEGCQGIGAANESARRFRGFTAPASLKAGDPAIIEVEPPRFRGFTAPASLKEVQLNLVGLEDRGFRGFTAPASLKGVTVDVACHQKRAFPGLYRPGLIEGWELRNSWKENKSVSGALPPRPH